MPDPLNLHSIVVPREWIDYNCHMSEGYYAQIFSDATDALYLHIGADAAWRERTRQTLYTVETHIRYLREVSQGATVSVATTIVGLDSKRIHIAHELFHGDEPVATQEALALAVNLDTVRATTLDPTIAEALSALTTASPPGYVGRAISLRPASPAA